MGCSEGGSEGKWRGGIGTRGEGGPVGGRCAFDLVRFTRFNDIEERALVSNSFNKKNS